MPEVDPRFIFSAERTMLAWIRTGLALMSLGFVIARFSESINSNGADYSLEVGLVLLLLGVWITFYSGVNYSRAIEKMKRNESVVDNPWGMGRVTSIILSIIGIFMIYYLIAR